MLMFNKKRKSERKERKERVGKKIVFLVAFVHEKNNNQVIENYFHEETIPDISDINTYGTLTYKILPVLKEKYKNVKVLNIQKFREGWVFKDEDKK